MILQIRQLQESIKHKKGKNNNLFCFKIHSKEVEEILLLFFG